jgi:glycosyltransferase involved in cell wall biosynthesis
MAAGMPVLAPDLPVFREVLGNGALYFNLTEPEDLADQVKRILSGEIDIKQLAERGHERALEIATQDKYIVRLKGVYNEVLSKSI